MAVAPCVIVCLVLVLPWVRSPSRLLTSDFFSWGVGGGRRGLLVSLEIFSLLASRPFAHDANL